MAPSFECASPGVAALVRRVDEAGGAPIGAYREPLSGRPILLASLPLGAVEPTPFQRDLSPTHVKRLAKKIEESGSFLDPLIVVRGAEGGFWTPNGRHRLAAAKVLGVSRPALSNLLNQNANLSGEMALRIEKAFGVKMDTLMRMQAAYDIVQTRKDARKIRVRRYHPDSAHA